jgi:hypothetical protein
MNQMKTSGVYLMFSPPTPDFSGRYQLTRVYGYSTHSQTGDLTIAPLFLPGMAEKLLWHHAKHDARAAFRPSQVKKEGRAGGQGKTCFWKSDQGYLTAIETTHYNIIRPSNTTKG